MLLRYLHRAGLSRLSAVLSSCHACTSSLLYRQVASPAMSPCNGRFKRLRGCGNRQKLFPLVPGAGIEPALTTFGGCSPPVSYPSMCRSFPAVSQLFARSAWHALTLPLWPVTVWARIYPGFPSRLRRPRPKAAGPASRCCRVVPGAGVGPASQALALQAAASL